MANAERDIENFAGDELGISIFKDAPSINLYTTQSGEAEKLHKVVRVLDGTGVPREISYFAETIINASLIKKRRLNSLLFLDAEKRDEAAKTFRGRIDMDNRLIEEVFKASDGLIVGRIRLQKIFYLLEQLGLKSYLRFFLIIIKALTQRNSRIIW